ncbi:MAG: multiheme c-type cytochrome [Candidatus Zixiibacteriota bacterium]
MTKKMTVLAMMLLAAFALVMNSVVAQEATTPAPAKADSTKAGAAKFNYVGDAKCKMCHKAEHTSWMTTVHAKAWEALKPEEQKKEECVGCHSTGKTVEGTLLTGVGCESCHGPGSEYKAQKVMKDKTLALAAGLTEPKKEVCIKCHNEKSPTFKGFEFDKAVKDAKAIHEKAPKKDAAPTKG